MDVDVVTETVIHRPCADVSGFASDPDRAPEWYVNIKRVQWQTERPLRVGVRIAFVGHFLGRRLAYTYEVAEWVPGERFVMRTAEGPSQGRRFPRSAEHTCRCPTGRSRPTLKMGRRTLISHAAPTSQLRKSSSAASQLAAVNGALGAPERAS